MTDQGDEHQQNGTPKITKLVQHNIKAQRINIVSADASETYTWEKPYFIRFSQLDSVCAFLWWMRLLAERDWFTKEHAVQLSLSYELLMRNEILPQRIHGQEFAADSEDLQP